MTHARADPGPGPHPATGADLDAVVIGAGVAGLHALHLLRTRGLRVLALDAAGDVGGVWWWHGHPGARVDTEGHLYQYLFSEELYTGWGWSERFPAGYEVQRWLRFVADRLDLRRDLRLSTRVLAAHWDRPRGRWRVRTDRAGTVETRFLVACAGRRPGPPEALPGDAAGFAGPVLDTACWPEGRHDLTGSRVGVVGTGPAGAQLVPRIAGTAGHLTVFAREPQHVLPMANPLYGWREREAYRARFAELARTLGHTATGWPDGAGAPEPSRADLEALYADGSLALWRAGLAARGGAAAAITGLARDRMRERLGDPRRGEVLVPIDHDLGARRPALEAGYLESFGRDDVDLVDLRDTPITEVRAGGVALADGSFLALDVLVRTRVPDAGAPALTGIDVRGRDGRSLADEWGGGPSTGPDGGVASHERCK